MEYLRQCLKDATDYTLSERTVPECLGHKLQSPSIISSSYREVVKRSEVNAITLQYTAHVIPVSVCY